MDKIIDILLYIDELYKDSENSESILLLKTENPEKYEMWRKAFEDYTLDDVKSAVRRYWTYKNDKTAPKVAHLLAYLEEDHKEDENKQYSHADNKPEFKAFAPAENFMARDIELKRCRHNLYVYQAAVRYILEDLLLREIPADVWRRLKFSDRYEMAKNKGLFDNFDEILVGVCRRDKGKDYEFDSEAMIEAQKANRAFNASKAAENLGTTWKNAWWHN